MRARRRPFAFHPKGHEAVGGTLFLGVSKDLAAGRFPEELIGRMWNASMIGDDEEFWPWQGEYWADEYEGWR